MIGRYCLIPTSVLDDGNPIRELGNGAYRLYLSLFAFIPDDKAALSLDSPAWRAYAPGIHTAELMQAAQDELLDKGLLTFDRDDQLSLPLAKRIFDEDEGIWVWAVCDE
jgi:hypothetical protein